MRRKLNFLFCTAILASLVSLSASAQRAAPDDYTITTTKRIAQPYDVRAMNDEFQTARLLGEQNGVGTFEITYRPFHVQKVGSDPNWRTNDVKMTEYIRPRTCANWDKDLQSRILNDLHGAGIDPAKLDDRTLVEKVSSWALKRSQFNNQFGLWMVQFDQGKPVISAEMKEFFESQEPSDMTLDQIYNRELYGKGMYLNKTHGACTSSSTYMATILRAVGIPTRIILTVPAFDPNDPMQVRLLSKAIRHRKAAQAIRIAGKANGFVNHVYNEVWVGGKWVRLNYDRLGQPILDANYCGLMTHVYTAKDISEIPFAKTWGARYALNDGPVLSSVNPYQLIAAKDNLKSGVVLDNPEVAVLNSVTVTAVLKPGDPALPKWVKLPADADAFFQIKEWIKDQNYLQLREFTGRAGNSFTLTAPGQPDLTASLTGLNISDERGGFQGFAVKLSAAPTPGQTYTIAPHNEGKSHRWLIPSTVTWKT